MNKPLIVPSKGLRVVTDRLRENKKNGEFDREAYNLGRHDGIRDCIHYLQQQGYIVEEYCQEKHG